jgi:glycosyltransferase involved in cell wall biosynthesis
VALDDRSAPQADTLVKGHPHGSVFGHPTRGARLNVKNLHRAIRSRVLNRSLRPFRADIFHVPAQFYFYHALRLELPYVVTVHDLIPFRLPSPRSKPARLSRRLKHLTAACRRARLVIAVSEHTRRECIELLGLDSERIAVVAEGAESRFAPRPNGDARVRRRLGLERPYFLYVGGLEAHKNVGKLFEAFQAFRKDDPEGHELILSGRPSEGASPPRPPAGARLLGFVDDEELPALYRGASALVTLSFHEGFALPVLEAMSCGTPVVAGSNTAFPETLGDAGLLVDAGDPLAAADAMRRVARDSRLVDHLRQRGLERASRYSWERAAEGTLAAYRRALGIE